MQALATVVSDHMGGARNYESLSSAYAAFQAQLKDRLQSRILPIGALSVGLPRHRALLFKTLADACELPCRLLRGSAIGTCPWSPETCPSKELQEFTFDGLHCTLCRRTMHLTAGSPNAVSVLSSI